MNTLTTKTKPSTNKAGRQRQQKESEKQTAPTLLQGAHQQEGCYQQVKEAEQLRAYHVAKLLDTPGYGHLAAETAADMVEQMLRLSCLLYEMLVEAEAPRQEQPIDHVVEPVKGKSKRGSKK